MLLRLFIGLVVLAGMSQSLTAFELLSNPGFEQGTALVCCEPCLTSAVPTSFWTFKTNCPQPYDSLMGSGFWDGSQTSWGGGPRVRSGSSSVRVYHFGGCMGDYKPGWRTSSIEQTVDVVPDQDYTASAWVYIWVSDYYSFVPGTYVKLAVYELNQTGDTAAAYEQVLASSADINMWKQLVISFHTTPGTSKIRFVLEQHWLQCCYLEHITWDDCSLDGPMAPVSIPAAKRLPDGASVRLVDKTVTAKFNGFFFVQEDDRTCGIRINGSAELGDKVEVVGTLTTINNAERAINPASINNP